MQAVVQLILIKVREETAPPQVKCLVVADIYDVRVVGWPKLASMAVFSSPRDRGVAVGLYLPLTAQVKDTTVKIATKYPFEDQATVTVTAPSKGTPVYLRVPGWAHQATINGNSVRNGTMAAFTCTATTCSYVVDFNPEVRLEQWGDTPGSPTGPYSVHRGPLMFSLPISGNYTVTAHHFGNPDMSNDYEVRPLDPWQYALDINSLEFVTLGTYQVRGPHGWQVCYSSADQASHPVLWAYFCP